MDQMTFHPSVNARVNKLGKRYEKLRAASNQLRMGINDFIYSTDAILVEFMAYNENLILLLSDMSIPEAILDQQMDLSDTMTAMMHKHMAMVLGLSRTAKSKTDPIYDFKEPLESAIAHLQQLHTDKEASLAEVARLEQQLHEFDQILLELNAALGNCHATVGEMQNILKRSVN